MQSHWDICGNHCAEVAHIATVPVHRVAARLPVHGWRVLDKVVEVDGDLTTIQFVTDCLVGDAVRRWLRSAPNSPFAGKIQGNSRILAGLRGLASWDNFVFSLTLISNLTFAEQGVLVPEQRIFRLELKKARGSFRRVTHV